MRLSRYLGQPTADAYASRVAAYRQALKESGFVEGENIRIEIPLGRQRQ
jgi:hypothetical protein